MSARTIAIGDIHGCAAALSALLDAVAPTPADTIVTLGDYIDRGTDSRGVINRLIALSSRCTVVSLIGNHEAMLVDAFRDSRALRRWLSQGGVDTLRSYGWVAGTHRRRLSDWIPDRHWSFFQGCKRYHETDTHIFLHGGYVPELPLAEQPDLALQWRMTDPHNTIAHCSGKVAIVGHTPQVSGNILDLGFLQCIDTNCVRGGWLTAMEVNEKRVWQANAAGRLRSANVSQYDSMDNE